MSGPSVLDELVAGVREDLERRRSAVSEGDLEARIAARSDTPSLLARIEEPGLGAIAEFKRSSPSQDQIRPGAGVPDVVAAYERAGAIGISVLTEERRFGGSLSDLREARAATSLPLLRKDFVVDRYQVLEAAAAGADAVLLIVAALGHGELAALREEALAFGLDALVEVHDERELEVALAAGADLVGINNRDLRTLDVSLEVSLRLAPEVPDGVAVVAESGISHPDEVVALKDAGVDAILVGTSLMASPDPGAALAALLHGAGGGV